MNATQQVNYNMAGSVQGFNGPTDPSLSAKAAELNKWITEAEGILASIDDKLFGPRPTDSPMAMGPQSPANLDNALALASSRVASICGWMKTISGKI